MISALTHLECSACGERYDADVPQNLCRDGKPLLVRYDLAAAARSYRTSSGFPSRQRFWGTSAS